MNATYEQKEAATQAHMHGVQKTYMQDVSAKQALLVYAGVQEHEMPRHCSGLSSSATSPFASMHLFRTFTQFKMHATCMQREAGAQEHIQDAN